MNEVKNCTLIQILELQEDRQVLILEGETGERAGGVDIYK